MRNILDSLKNHAVKELSKDMKEEYKDFFPLVQLSIEAYNDFIAEYLEECFNRKINQIIYLVLNESDEVKEALINQAKLNKIKIEYIYDQVDKVKLEGRIIWA